MRIHADPDPQPCTVLTDTSFMRVTNSDLESTYKFQQNSGQLKKNNFRKGAEGRGLKGTISADSLWQVAFKTQRN
jgi:hypothetical protein